MTVEGAIQSLETGASYLRSFGTKLEIGECQDLAKNLENAATLIARTGEILNVLRPFAFLNSPESFNGKDGECTEALIDDSDVQRAREFFT